jgi:DNA-binding transcriptional ArsR family regulator
VTTSDPDAPDAGAVFSALADATRRAVVRRLAEGGPATATELAEELPVTRQAVAKHLGALAAAGLVSADRQGRETRYTLTPEPMTEAVSWMATVGGEWDDRLSNLAGFLATGSAPPKKRRPGFT